MSATNEMELIHQPGCPLGWVRHQGVTYPVWVCCRTGRPISPGNPGTLYWEPDTGAMMVQSDRAEETHGEPDGFPYSTELDELSRHLLCNTVGKEQLLHGDAIGEVHVC